MTREETMSAFAADLSGLMKQYGIAGISCYLITPTDTLGTFTPSILTQHFDRFDAKFLCAYMEGVIRKAATEVLGSKVKKEFSGKITTDSNKVN